MFLTENEILMGKDKDQHITMRSLTLLIFAADLSIVWSTTTLLYLIYIYYISYYIHGPLGDENIFAVLYVSLRLWALHIVIKTVFFTFIFAVFLLNLLYTGCYS